MRLFPSRPRLTPSERESLTAAWGPGHGRPTVLAVARGVTVARPAATPGMPAEGVREVTVAALTTHLAYGATDDWTLIPWHEVDHGGWNPETLRLEIDQRGVVEGTLVRPGGRRHRIQLPDPDRVPEVMTERVTASIVFSRQLQMPESNGALTVVARRDLAAQTIVWLAVPSRGMKVDDEDVRAFSAAAVRRLSTEFG